MQRTPPPTIRGRVTDRQDDVHQHRTTVVHTARVSDDWPAVSPPVRELFRRGAEVALDPRAAWVEEVHAAALGGSRMRPVAEDPVLAAATRRSTLANLLHWAAANVQHPAVRVPVALGPEAGLRTRRGHSR